VLDTLHAYATNKKSGYERESAAVALHSLAAVLGPPAAPLLLPSLPTLFDQYADKGDVVRVAAAAAAKALLALFPPEATGLVFRQLEAALASAKWGAKVGALDALRASAARAREHVAAELGATLPAVEHAMHDTKREVSAAATKCATALCGTLANPDLTPHIPALVRCMADPATVPACIKALSSTTFVAEVTAPALAVLVPLLLRALGDRSMDVQRRTVVVIDNLVKLVRAPAVAARYLSPLVDGVQRIATGAAFPEVRAFADAALQTLIKAGASAGAAAPPPPTRDAQGEKAAALAALLTCLPHDLLLVSQATPNGPHQPRHPLLAQVLDFEAALVADLVHARDFDHVAAWQRAVGVCLGPWHAPGEDASAVAERVRAHFEAIDRVRVSPVSLLRSR
jgi:elongation factor 3